MKFKLVEDFDRGLETQSSANTLNESKVYKLMYTNSESDEDYAYIIGGDKSDFTSKGNIITYLQKQQANHEKISSNAESIIAQMPDNNIKVIELDGKPELHKSFNEKEKFLNLTHRTSRGKAPTISGYLRHHLDGIEHNNASDNILGISEGPCAKAIHQLLHEIDFSKKYLYGVKDFDVCKHNGEEFVPCVLRIKAEVIDNEELDNI